VWLTDFGDSGVNFELVVWPKLDAVKRPGAMMAAYRWALDDALRSHGLEIPFPQLDLRVRSLFGREGEAGVHLLDEGRRAEDVPEATSSAGAPAPSKNDANEDLDAAMKGEEAERTDRRRETPPKTPAAVPGE
jgi:hypothetical protein